MERDYGYELYGSYCCEGEGTEAAINSFRDIFPDHEYQNLQIEEISMINYTMYYIAKFYNDRIEKLFDYNEILCYPFQRDLKLYVGEEIDYNDDFEPEKYYPHIERVIKLIYQKLKNYIYKYIGKYAKPIPAPTSVPKRKSKKNQRNYPVTEESVVEEVEEPIPFICNGINVSIEKINAEIIAMNNGYFRTILEQYYLYILDDHELNYGNLNGELSIWEILSLSDIPHIYFCQDYRMENTIDYKYHKSINEYAIKLLAQIAEKLYFFILARVKRIIEEKVIVNPNIKLVEGVNIPQQLVDWDDAFAPVDIKQIIPQVSYGIDIFQSIQQTQEEFAASVEVNSDLIKLYDTLDTYNKTMVNSFAQIILKYKNGVTQ